MAESIPVFEPGVDNRAKLTDLERRFLTVTTVPQGLYSGPRVCRPDAAGIWATGTYAAGAYIPL